MTASLEQLSLEQLADLNDEIIGLTRAGVPLEGGLARFAKETRGSAGDVAATLSARIAAGESLTDGLRSEGGRFPEMYATIVESGIRAGRLPVALEAVSDFAREFAELRRTVLQAMVYPLVTMMAAYALFVVFITQVVQHIATWRDLAGESSAFGFRTLQWMLDNLQLWVWIPPAALMLGTIAWMRSGRASSFGLRRTSVVIWCLPGMNRIVRCYRHSLFARLAALLIEHGVPFHHAVRLAATGCGRSVERAALAFAAADERGDRSQVVAQDARGMRPLLRWMLKRQQPGGQLVSGLRMAAQNYYEKGQATVRWMRFALPVLFTLVVAGGLTALYAVSLFLPVTELMQQLSGVNP